MQYYVDINAPSSGNGSKEHPFSHINEAAHIARPGDEVFVLPGIYREEVNPAFGGTEDKRIIYRALEPGKAVVTGAEPLTDWTHAGGNVWTAKVSNCIFTGRNPYTTLACGDWLDISRTGHLGEVFIDGKSMYEVPCREQVFSPKPSDAAWDRDFSTHVWYAEQDGNDTVFYANFQGKSPAEHNIEFTVRKSCFMPSKEGIGFITVSGFCFTKAATQWAPPTAYQEGMVGPHWSKGWIIEDCEISHSRCSGISLGKYLQPENDNKWLKEKYKDGTQTERDAICQALREGWSKERIGSHIVRRCNIHDCGQTGIVGHLGGVFSLIEDNHIHHINNKGDLAGAEIGGIKMHAAIDVTIRHNHIHHCTRGLWLDWQAQGTRVTQNLFHDNCLPFEHLMTPEGLKTAGEDIFIEVSHGPTLVDNNVLLSIRALKLPTQGCAFVHNLICGSICAVGRGVDNGSKSLPSPRYTPYHVPHSTQLAGFMTILHGDMRFCNNIFLQQLGPQAEKLAELAESFEKTEWEDMNVQAGLQPFDCFPSEEEWKAQFDAFCGMGSPASDRYYSPLPVWTGGNAYINGACPRKGETDAAQISSKAVINLTEENGRMVLRSDLAAALAGTTCSIIGTRALGKAFEPEQRFEAPDGSPIVFDTDILGRKRTGDVIPGPFAGLSDEIRLSF